jgi:hypothetical protein
VRREHDEFLSRAKFDFLRMANFDFLVATRVTEPIFAVEFDGPPHGTAEQVARDIIKNRLCKISNRREPTLVRQWPSRHGRQGPVALQSTIS